MLLQRWGSSIGKLLLKSFNIYFTSVSKKAKGTYYPFFEACGFIKEKKQGNSRNMPVPRLLGSQACDSGPLNCIQKMF